MHEIHFAIPADTFIGTAGNVVRNDTTYVPETFGGGRTIDTFNSEYRHGMKTYFILLAVAIQNNQWQQIQISHIP